MNTSIWLACVLRGEEMIEVTRLNKKTFLLNCEWIETVEETPDTVITLTNGKKYVVSGKVEEVLQKVVEYKQRCLIVSFLMNKLDRGVPFGRERHIYNLLAIIAVLTLSLAVLIIFLFISYNPNQQQAANISPGASISERIVPDEEMLEFKLFGGEEKLFALKSEQENPNSLVMVSVTIKCDAGERRRREKDIATRVNTYISEMEEAVGDYFAAMTLTEAKELETRYKARDDLLTPLMRY